MSISSSSPPPPSVSPTSRQISSEPFWAKPSIGILSFVIFAAALYVTWKYDKTDAFNLLIGAVIANVTTVVSYYFGSSSGSAHKTELLSQALPPPPASGREGGEQQTGR